MAFYNRKLLLGEDSKVCAGPCIHPPLPPASKHPTPTISVLWLGILGAAFLFLSYFALRWFASRRRSSPRSAVNSNYNYDHNNREDFTVVDHPIWFIRTLGLPQSAVDSIQMLSYGKGDGLIESSDCSVCLSEFQEGDTLRLLPKCSHAFHVPCIDTWLRSHTTCPLCRAPILQNLSTAGELSESESETERVEDDGVVIDQEQPVEPMRRSVSMDFCSHIQPKESFSSKRSISFSLYA